VARVVVAQPASGDQPGARARAGVGRRVGRNAQRGRPVCLVFASQTRGSAADRDCAWRRLHSRAMIPRSLTWRSTLVALVIVSVGIDVLVGRHLRGSLDRSLRERAVAVAQLSATAPALLVSPGALDAPAGGTQVLTQVLDRRGRIVARSLALG